MSGCNGNPRPDWSCYAGTGDALVDWIKAYLSTYYVDNDKLNQTLLAYLQKNYNYNELNTTEKKVLDAINELFAEVQTALKQGATYNSLQTQAKTIVAAINEVLTTTNAVNTSLNNVAARLSTQSTSSNRCLSASEVLAAIQSYVDNKYVLLSGGNTIQGDNRFSSALPQAYGTGPNPIFTPTNNADLTPKKYVDQMDQALNDKIDAIKARGRYLTLLDASNGTVKDEPTTSPYSYKSGDYFIVSVGGYYKPNGSQYIVGGANNFVVGTDLSGVNDTYYYDGVSWQLLSGGASNVVPFSNITGQPSDNTNLATALNGKQATLTAGNNITISNNTISATDTTYTAGTGIDITNNTISVTDTNEYLRLSGGTMTGNITFPTYKGIISENEQLGIYFNNGQSVIKSKGTFEPSQTATYSLGTVDRKWKDAFISGQLKDGTNSITVAQIAAKQDALVSGTNIKTVGGTSILGSGDIPLNVLPTDPSSDGNYVLQDSVVSGTATKSWVENGMFNVINASDIASTKILTQEQYELFTNGKPTLILGNLYLSNANKGGGITIKNPIFYCNQGYFYYRYGLEKGAGNSDGYDYEVIYRINENTKYLEIWDNLITYHSVDRTTKIFNLINLNNKSFPSYPSSPTNNKALTYKTDNTLAWEDVGDVVTSEDFTIQ